MGLFTFLLVRGSHSKIHKQQDELAGALLVNNLNVFIPLPHLLQKEKDLLFL